MTIQARSKNTLKAQLRETIADFCHEKIHGKDEKRRAQAISLLYETPEGKALLDLAAEHNVPIRFMRAGKVGALGSLSKNPDDATVGVSVANTGNVTQMVLTLYHELRHLQQQDEQGDIRKGVFQTLKNPRRSHMLSLMQEADAFAGEAIFALDRHAAGDKRYLDSMLSRGDDVARVSARYIKTAPVPLNKTAMPFAAVCLRISCSKASPDTRRPILSAMPRCSAKRPPSRNLQILSTGLTSCASRTDGGHWFLPMVTAIWRKRL
jgi:hypothetical protein